MTEVFYAMDHVLLIADYNDPQRHKHWAKHFIVSLCGEINCMIANQQIACKGIMISSDVFHTIESNGNSVLVYLFDETADIAHEIEKKYLRGDPYYVMEPDRVQQINNIWNHCIDGKNVGFIQTGYSDIYQEVLAICHLSTGSPNIRDERVKKALSLLRDKEEIAAGTIKELSKALCLSPSRLCHLFKEQAGVSLNSFLVVMKITKAYEYLFAGENVTEASIRAGFSSPSHFVTTNKSMFGLSANEFRKGARLIRV